MTGIIILFLGTCFTTTVAIDNVKNSNIPISKGNTLYVGGSGEGNYTSIQEAIDDTSDGDTVFVFDDSSPYIENIIVYKSINLKGEDKNTTIIDGDEGVHVINVKETDYVNISGFTLINSAEEYSPEIFGAGVNLKTATNCNISGNILTDNGRWGIRMEGVRHTTIIGNYIGKGGYSGISDYGSKYCVIKNNVIDRNGHVGIRFRETSYIDVIGNIISKNGWYGIDDDSTSGKGPKYIKYNLITGNEKGLNLGGWGGRLHLATIVSENNITNNDIGVLFDDTERNIVTRNNFINNKIHILYEILPLGWIMMTRSNRCSGNYYDGRTGFLPKPIFGIRWVAIILSLVPWVSIEFRIPWLPLFDWNPAKEPYDIGI